jgi:hypothetical protein
MKTKKLYTVPELVKENLDWQFTFVCGNSEPTPGNEGWDGAPAPAPPTAPNRSR